MRKSGRRGFPAAQNSFPSLSFFFCLLLFPANFTNQSSLQRYIVLSQFHFIPTSPDIHLNSTLKNQLLNISKHNLFLLQGSMEVSKTLKGKVVLVF
jgi:hypothetical protein